MTQHRHPKSIFQAAYIYLTGLCMGAADIVPGVSGGTIAFIMGVYEDLLESIKSVNVTLLKKLLKGDIKGCFAQVPVLFLVLLLGGIVTAILSLVKAIRYAMEHHAVLLFAFFFGLVVASIYVLARRQPWTFARVAGLALGTAIGYLVVTLTPHEMSHSAPALFLAGAIAICAMILPGISGSFLLLILGQYGHVTQLVDDRAILSLLPFVAGMVVGILLFARFLSWVLSRWHVMTVCVLIGFMLGSLWKLYPWREATRTELIHGKVRILEEAIYLPEVNTAFWAAIGCMVLGMVTILVVEGINNLRRGVRGV